MSDNYRERETTLVHRQFRHELIQNQDLQITKRAEGNNQDKSSDVVDSSSSSSPASGPRLPCRSALRLAESPFADCRAEQRKSERLDRRKSATKH